MLISPDKPNVRAALMASPLLKVVSGEQLDALAAESHAAFAERGEVIWLQGVEIPFVGIVASGFVKMVRSSPSGQEMAVEVMGPGQVFGLLGAIDGTGCPLSARAVTQAWYIKSSKRVMQQVYAVTPALQDQLVRRTTTRLRQAYDLMSHMSGGRVEQRLAAVMLLLLQSYGKEDGQEWVLSIPLTRADMAELAGTTVETAIRIMSRWQKEGLVSTERQTIRIHDEHRLAEQLAMA